MLLLLLLRPLGLLLLRRAGTPDACHARAQAVDAGPWGTGAQRHAPAELGGLSARQGLLPSPPPSPLLQPSAPRHTGRAWEGGLLAGAWRGQSTQAGPADPSGEPASSLAAPQAPSRLPRWTAGGPAEHAAKALGSAGGVAPGPAKARGSAGGAPASAQGAQGAPQGWDGAQRRPASPHQHQHRRLQDLAAAGGAQPQEGQYTSRRFDRPSPEGQWGHRPTKPWRTYVDSNLTVEQAWGSRAGKANGPVGPWRTDRLDGAVMVTDAWAPPAPAQGQAQARGQAQGQAQAPPARGEAGAAKGRSTKGRAEGGAVGGARGLGSRPQQYTGPPSQHYTGVRDVIEQTSLPDLALACDRVAATRGGAMSPPALVVAIQVRALLKSTNNINMYRIITLPSRLIKLFWAAAERENTIFAQNADRLNTHF
jgi:hypothetical protein